MPDPSRRQIQRGALADRAHGQHSALHTPRRLRGAPEGLQPAQGQAAQQDMSHGGMSVAKQEIKMRLLATATLTALAFSTPAWADAFALGYTQRGELVWGMEYGYQPDEIYGAAE